jgi:hypothetical protein
VRYAAKLLFQLRVDLGKHTGKRRICQERIINYQAESDRKASESLVTALRRPGW